MSWIIQCILQCHAGKVSLSAPSQADQEIKFVISPLILFIVLVSDRGTCNSAQFSGVPCKARHVHRTRRLSGCHNPDGIAPCALTNGRGLQNFLVFDQDPSKSLQNIEVVFRKESNFNILESLDNVNKIFSKQ